MVIEAIVYVVIFVISFTDFTVVHMSLHDQTCPVQ